MLARLRLLRLEVVPAPIPVPVRNTGAWVLMHQRHPIPPPHVALGVFVPGLLLAMMDGPLGAGLLYLIMSSLPF